MQISTLISKPVLSPSGAAYGYITDVRLTRDYAKISCLVCADEEEEEFYLPMRTVLSVSDAVIAGKARLSSPTGIPSPVGKTAYSFTGELLGTVSDVILEEDEETKLVVGGRDLALPISHASVHETVIVYPDAAKKNAAAKQGNSSSKPKRETSKTREIQKEESKNADAATANVAPPAVQMMGRTNLLGRYLRRSVYDGKGTLIAMQGERITPAVLQSARRAGKLLELTVNTLTNYS